MEREWMDHATKIHYLTLIIKSICDENDLCKKVVIDDFEYLMTNNGNREEE